MILDFARKTYLRTFILLCITAALLWIKELAGVGVATAGSENNMPLLLLFKEFFGLTSYPLRDALLTSSITILSACILMLIAQKNDILRGYDYLVAFIFVLYSLALPFQKVPSGVHLAALFCIFSFNRLLSVYDSARNATAGKIFIACFWIGLAGLIYPPTLFLLPVCLIGVALLKVFSWRDFFIGVFGTATAPAMALVCFYVMDMDIPRLFGIFTTYFTFGKPAFLTATNTSGFNPAYVCFAYLILLNIAALFTNVRGTNIKTSRMLGTLRASTLVLMAATFIFPAMQTGYMLIIVAISTATFTASLLAGVKNKKLANTLLLLLIASCILLQFFL